MNIHIRQGFHEKLSLSNSLHIEFMHISFWIVNHLRLKIDRPQRQRRIRVERRTESYRNGKLYH